jgi:hypothetical protein
MADERLLAPIRRFMTKEQIEEVYQKIWEANLGQLDSVTVIVGKSSESESAQGQVIVNRQDYLETMAAMEARLQELATAAAGDGPSCETEHVNFGRRFTRT